MTQPSQNAIAQALGISKSQCSDLVKRGMPIDSVDAAQAWREANLDPARRKGGPGGSTPRPAESSAWPETFDEARTRDKTAEANLREMTAAKRRGELIEVAAVRTVMAQSYSTIRDALLQIPARMGPLLAAETDPAQVQNLLHAEIHTALTELAGASDSVQAIADRGEE
jgi:phage terminase Nu1 subunit (DNA packaging protein)